MVQFIRWTRLRVLFGMLAFLLLAAWAAADEPTEDARILAHVSVTGAIAGLGIPIHAHLLDAAGQEYVLTLVSEQTLQQRQLSYRVLDAVAALKPDEWYLLAYERRQGARQQASAFATVLYDDGRRLLVRATPSQAEQLANLGFELAWLRKRPMILRVAPRLRTKAITPLPLIQGMIDQVTQSTVTAYTSCLSGVTPVVIGGSSYTIKTRYTDSGTPIQKATQYVYEHLQALGLTVSYQNWSDSGSSGRNVIGELPGTSKPTEIVLITAHLDDMPSGTLAPGADDNASGSVGVMIAADVLSAYAFERTVRFVFFTGEEQDLLGSYAYAEAAYAANENIVAVYNLDMIAWDNEGGPVLRLHTRPSSNSGYAGDLALAQLLIEVINNYGLSSSLTPVTTKDGDNASDHASFWDVGYAAVFMIEDDYDDFNEDNYHTRNDTLDKLDLPYFTAMVKASVGAIAHQAVPIPQTGSSFILWRK